MVSAYCNAHARRKFDEAKLAYEKEGQFYLEKYQEIYKIEAEKKNKTDQEILEFRSKMKKELRINNGGIRNTI